MDLNILANGRRPQYLYKWKQPQFSLENESQPQIFGKWKTTQIFSSGTGPENLGKCRTTSIFWQMEE